MTLLTRPGTKNIEWNSPVLCTVPANTQVMKNVVIPTNTAAMTAKVRANSSVRRKLGLRNVSIQPPKFMNLVLATAANLAKSRQTFTISGIMKLRVKVKYAGSINRGY